MDKKNKLIIADFDGTLFDTDSANYHAYITATEICGKKLQITREEFLHKTRGKSYKDFLVGEFEYTLSEAEEIHREKVKQYAKEAAETVGVNKHLLHMLRCLSGEYYIALVTTASLKSVQAIIKAFQLVDFFDLIITSEDVNCVKPNPEGYYKAMNFFQVESKDTVIFEDSEVGISGAQMTGAALFKVEHF